MNPVIERLIEIAKGEVGTREAEINNTGARIVEYQGASWLQPGAWPWCAAFTCWLMREVLEEPDTLEFLRKHYNRDELTFAQADKVRCRDASAFGWEKWARKNNFQVLSEDNLAKAGDFVVFDFSHIGLVIEDQASINDKIKTIEGNTNGRGERDSESGDGVWMKERARSLTKSYIRLFG